MGSGNSMASFSALMTRVLRSARRKVGALKSLVKFAKPSESYDYYLGSGSAAKASVLAGAGAR